MAPKRATALEVWGKEFARAREDAGLSQKALAKAAYISPSLIGMWEIGKRAPKAKDLARCEEIMGTGGRLAWSLENWVPRETAHEWLDQWISIEEQTNQLLWFETTVIPGLLQTDDYARTVLGLRTWAHNVEEQVHTRLERQKILIDDGAPLFVAVLDEAVFRRPVGSPKIMYGQLMHIIELAKRPNVIVQVIPFDRGEHAGFGGPFVIASVNGKDVAYVDNVLRGGVEEHPEDVTAVKRLWSMLTSAAMHEEASLNFIAEVARSWAVP